MTTPTETTGLHTGAHNFRVPFADLKDPGAYVNNQTGCLYRVPEDALVNGRSPLVEIVTRDPNLTMMTKISDDAWIQISKARQLAADADLYVCF